MDPLTPDRIARNPNLVMYGTFTLRCTFCDTERNVDEHQSVGWVVGQPVGKDPSNPDFGRCIQCSRHSLIVAKVPVMPPPENKTGFTKIPEK